MKTIFFEAIPTIQIFMYGEASELFIRLILILYTKFLRFKIQTFSCFEQKLKAKM